MTVTRIAILIMAGVLLSPQYLFSQSVNVERNAAFGLPNISARDNPRQIAYTPMGNDATIDPLNNRFNEWQAEAHKRAQTEGAFIDPSYEQFVRDVSGVTFSLGEQQLPEDAKNLLQSIPAGSLKPITPEVRPKKDVEIARGVINDPFAENDSEDVEFSIEVKEKDIAALKLLQIGYNAIGTGQYEVAVSVYNRVLDSDPENVQALFGLATAYQRNKQNQQARETYSRILTLDQEHWPSLNNFLILVAEEAPEDALKELQALEQVNPEFSPIPAHIAAIHAKMGRLDDAAKNLTRAVILSPNNIYYRYNLAVLYDHMGRYKQAKNLYMQVVKAGLEGENLPAPVSQIQDRLVYLSNQIRS